MLNFGKENTNILEHFHSIGYKLDAAYDFHMWDDKFKRFERILDSVGKKEIYRRNSPLSHVSEDDPPILLIHGDQDNVVPIQQSKLMASRLAEVGVTFKLLTMKGQGHGWNAPLENETEEVLGWFDKNLNKE